MYATATDMRAEGVGVAQASDARLALVLDEATQVIDRLTGWFFEPRLGGFRCHGRGSPTIELPVPAIRVDRVALEESGFSYPRDTLVVVGAPVLPGFDGPRISLRHGHFPRGYDNVTVEGLFGYTEPDGTPVGRTPPGIRRACILLALRNLPPLADEASVEARTRWRVIEERTRDQSYRLEAPQQSSAVLTGDPEIDLWLLPYVRPPRMGAV